MRLLSAVLIIVPLVLAAQAPDAIDDPDSWPREQPTALPRIFTDSQEAILADTTRLGGTATTACAEGTVPPSIHPVVIACSSSAKIRGKVVVVAFAVVIQM
jgi:hypothetical protein